MKIEELDYELPKELIAQKPIAPRDKARLLVVDKKSGQTKDTTFGDLPQFLKKGDVLVFNKTKVFSARIVAEKETGGKLEVVFLTENSPGVWGVIIGGKSKTGQKINFSDFTGEVIEKKENVAQLKVEKTKTEIYDFLEKEGMVPLPPYIKREAGREDKKNYQTIFAKNIGSAAAPTASLHFTDRLLKDLKEKGIQVEFVILHVGLGTFAPVKTAKVEKHPIHSEYFEIDGLTLKRLQKAKNEKRRVIAVGTTVTRALESVFLESATPPSTSTSTIFNSSLQQRDENKNGVIGGGEKGTAMSGMTSMFILPGYKFQAIDGLITNFHTPRSSLLALVFAFLGKERTKAVYQEAIRKKYRFFSYGDGMLIL